MPAKSQKKTEAGWFPVSVQVDGSPHCFRARIVSVSSSGFQPKKGAHEVCVGIQEDFSKQVWSCFVEVIQNEAVTSVGEKALRDFKRRFSQHMAAHIREIRKRRATDLYIKAQGLDRLVGWKPV